MSAVFDRMGSNLCPATSCAAISESTIREKTRFRRASRRLAAHATIGKNVVMVVSHAMRVRNGASHVILGTVSRESVKQWIRMYKPYPPTGSANRVQPRLDPVFRALLSLHPLGGLRRAISTFTFGIFIQNGRLFTAARST